MASWHSASKSIPAWGVLLPARGVKDIQEPDAINAYISLIHILIKHPPIEAVFIYSSLSS